MTTIDPAIRQRYQAALAAARPARSGVGDRYRAALAAAGAQDPLEQRTQQVIAGLGHGPALPEFAGRQAAFESSLSAERSARQRGLEDERAFNAAAAQAAEQAGPLGRFGANVAAGFGQATQQAQDTWNAILPHLNADRSPLANTIQMDRMAPELTPEMAAVGGQAGALSRVGGQLLGGLAGSVVDPVTAPLMAATPAASARVMGSPVVQRILSGIEQKAGPKAATAAARILEASDAVGALEAVDAGSRYPNWLEDPGGGLLEMTKAAGLGVAAGAALGAPGAAAAFTPQPQQTARRGRVLDPGADAAAPPPASEGPPPAPAPSPEPGLSVATETPQERVHEQEAATPELAPQVEPEGGAPSRFADGGGEQQPAPAADAGPLPERPETVKAQVGMVADGRRRAMLVTPGETEPVVPRGLKRLQSELGTFVYNPETITPGEILRAVREDRVGDVLDYGIPRKPAAEEAAGVVTVRGADGVEKQAVVTDAAHAAAVVESARRVAGEGDTVAVESPEAVVSGRMAADEGVGRSTPEPQPPERPSGVSDRRPTLVDPGELVFREFQQNNLDTVRGWLTADVDPADVPAVVGVRTERGIEIIDGHNRTAVAREVGLAGIPVLTIDGAAYEHLRSTFDDMEIVAGVLQRAGDHEGVSRLGSQFSGSDILSKADDVEAALNDLDASFDRTAPVERGPAVSEPPPATQPAEAPSVRPASDEAGDADLTSARKAWLDRDRAALGLDTLNSPERRTWEAALQGARDEGIPDRAMHLAAEVNATPRALSDVETAGLVVHAATLKNQHKAAMQRVSESKDPADTAAAAAEARRIEEEFDALSTALRASGTEKGRALAAQKLTLDQDLSLVAMKAQAKAAKGKALSAAESARIEAMSKQMDEQAARVAELERKLADQVAQRALQHARTRGRARKRTKPDLDAEFDQLIAQTKALLKAGCKDT